MKINKINYASVLGKNYKKIVLEKDQLEEFTNRLNKYKDAIETALNEKQLENATSNFLSPLFKGKEYQLKSKPFIEIHGNVEVDLAIFKDNKAEALMELKTSTNSIEMIAMKRIHETLFLQPIVSLIMQND
jgi:hypothetical protein